MAKTKTIYKFIYIPYKRKLTKLAQQNRDNPSPAEKKIWYEVLCRKQFEEYKFTRQKPITNFIVDYYCSKLQLVIEIDGDSHVENKEYDEARTSVLNQYGLKVLRYTNRDVMNNIEGVYQDLMWVVKPPLYSPLSGGQKSKSLLLRREKKHTPVKGLQGKTYS
ncbi:MAG TPA: endonuclease domain-containing protein [candidate division Zixibacteria bacterium]